MVGVGWGRSGGKLIFVEPGPCGAISGENAGQRVFRAGERSSGLHGAIRIRREKLRGKLARWREVDPKLRAGWNLFPQGRGCEGGAERCGRWRAGLLHRPVCAVPTEDMGPCFRGRIGDGDDAGSLNLCGGCEDVRLREGGWPVPDAQRGRLRGAPLRHLEDFAGLHFGTLRTDNFGHGASDALERGDAQLDFLAVAVRKRRGEFAANAHAGDAADVEPHSAVIAGSERGGANLVRGYRRSTEERRCAVASRSGSSSGTSSFWITALTR